MEAENQNRKLNVQQKQSKAAAKHSSIRIRNESKKALASILKRANSKSFGRKIKIDDLLGFAIGLITDEHVNALKNQSMTNEDRKEILRQKYISLNGPISKDAFIGFMMSAAFTDFVNEARQADIAS